MCHRPRHLSPSTLSSHHPFPPSPPPHHTPPTGVCLTVSPLVALSCVTHPTTTTDRHTSHHTHLHVWPRGREPPGGGARLVPRAPHAPHAAACRARLLSSSCHPGRTQELGVEVQLQGNKVESVGGLRQQLCPESELGNVGGAVGSAVGKDAACIYRTCGDFVAIKLRWHAAAHGQLTSRADCTDCMQSKGASNHQRLCAGTRSRSHMHMSSTHHAAVLQHKRGQGLCVWLAMCLEVLECGFICGPMCGRLVPPHSVRLLRQSACSLSGISVESVASGISACATKLH